MPLDTDHIQLVWDRECGGTAQAQSGCSIQVGPSGEWTPEQLLVAAAESSLMTIFLRLAGEAGLEVLGYVSAAGATFETDDPLRPTVVVRPCIVVGREEDQDRARRLLRQTAGISPVARALGDALRVDGDVIVVAAAGEAS